jgi:hypothetical protein
VLVSLSKLKTIICTGQDTLQLKVNIFQPNKKKLLLDWLMIRSHLSQQYLNSLNVCVILAVKDMHKRINDRALTHSPAISPGHSTQIDAYLLSALQKMGSDDP